MPGDLNLSAYTGSAPGVLTYNHDVTSIDRLACLLDPSLIRVRLNQRQVYKPVLRMSLSLLIEIVLEILIPDKFEAQKDLNHCQIEVLYLPLLPVDGDAELVEGFDDAGVEDVLGDAGSAGDVDGDVNLCAGVLLL